MEQYVSYEEFEKRIKAMESNIGNAIKSIESGIGNAIMIASFASTLANSNLVQLASNSQDIEKIIQNTEVAFNAFSAEIIYSKATDDQIKLYQEYCSATLKILRQLQSNL